MSDPTGDAMLGKWLRKRRGRNMVDRWFVVVDETMPDLKDPALVIHVVDLEKELVPSIARRRVRWQSIPATLDYFNRESTDSGLRPITKSAAAEIAQLWGANFPPSVDDWQ